MEIVKLQPKAINKIIETINNGGIVVCPTDTVYGFLADASNKKAVDKIYKIKNRPRSKPLPVFVRDLKMAKELAEIDERQEKIITLRLRSGQAKYWPGKYTFVLLRKGKDTTKLARAKFVVYGVDKKTIALRVPKYKFLNDLLKKINKPLAQTSVNVSGQPPIIKIGDIIEKFGRDERIDLIIDAGNLKKSKSSKITDLVVNRILRK